jgi:hypothetical protein
MVPVRRKLRVLGLALGALQTLAGCGDGNGSDEDGDVADGGPFQASPSFVELEGATLGLGERDDTAIAKQVATTVTDSDGALQVAPTADYYLDGQLTSADDDHPSHCELSMAVTNVSDEPRCDIAIAGLGLRDASGELLQTHGEEGHFFGSLAVPAGSLEEPVLADQCLAPGQTGWAIFPFVESFDDCMRVASVTVGKAVSEASPNALSVRNVVATAYEVAEGNEILLHFENTHSGRLKFGAHVSFLDDSGNALAFSWVSISDNYVESGDTSFISAVLDDALLGSSNRLRIFVDASPGW